MSLHPIGPAGARRAPKVHPETETAEIHEIFPGASAAAPLRARKSRRPGWLRRPGRLRRLGWLRRLVGSEAGMATAEYAIATLAAVGFAGILVFIMRSDEVRGFLLNLIRTALALP